MVVLHGVMVGTGRVQGVVHERRDDRCLRVDIGVVFEVGVGVGVGVEVRVGVGVVVGLDVEVGGDGVIPQPPSTYVPKSWSKSGNCLQYCSGCSTPGGGSRAGSWSPSLGHILFMGKVKEEVA